MSIKNYTINQNTSSFSGDHLVQFEANFSPPIFLANEKGTDYYVGLKGMSFSTFSAPITAFDNDFNSSEPKLYLAISGTDFVNAELGIVQFTPDTEEDSRSSLTIKPKYTFESFTVDCNTKLDELASDYGVTAPKFVWENGRMGFVYPKTYIANNVWVTIGQPKLSSMFPMFFMFYPFHPFANIPEISVFRFGNSSCYTGQEYDTNNNVIWGKYTTPLVYARSIVVKTSLPVANTVVVNNNSDSSDNSNILAEFNLLNDDVYSTQQNYVNYQPFDNQVKMYKILSDSDINSIKIDLFFRDWEGVLHRLKWSVNSISLALVFKHKKFVENYPSS